jgi:rRNA maturation endonuclease Nob1
MIQVTLPWFVCLYLALFLAGILVLWIGYEVIRKRRANGIARERIFCRICGTRYTDTSSAELLECPVCGSKNERISLYR